MDTVLRSRLVPGLIVLGLGYSLWAYGTGFAASVGPAQWRRQWRRTDFRRRAAGVAHYEWGWRVASFAGKKDGIPAIDAPAFVSAAEVDGLSGDEPVIGLALGGQARAYPLRILLRHEIVNDAVAGVPVAVTYCPLCNSAVVFERALAGRVLDFGTTGKLLDSNLLMYDRQSESWWLQFRGEAVVGAMAGARLRALPARLESFARFAARWPDGIVLRPPEGGRRRYGTTPYAGYDTARVPFLYFGPRPANVRPLAYVVAVGEVAWSLDLLRARGCIEHEDLVLTWRPGQRSVLDARRVRDGRDLGDVAVRRRTAAGLQDVPYMVTFAFAFRAFHPRGTLHLS